MYYLIENKRQLEGFKKYKYENVFIEIISSNNKIHPTKNSICAFYIRPELSYKGYILPIQHSETQNLELEEVIELIRSYKTVEVRDKKLFLHYLPLKTLNDIALSVPTYIPEHCEPKVYYHFYKQHKDYQYINSVIPIVKHYEYCQELYGRIKKEPIQRNTFYDTKAALVFNHIESNGIKIDKTIFAKHFYETDDDFMYPQFNYKTITRRPSNVFNGVNYAALSKSDGSRQAFIPRNSTFIELDISAYHPTLLAKLVNYKFDDPDIHKSFARMYNVEYKKAKELTFKQMYGGVFNEYKDLPFFKLMAGYTNKLWARFQEDGYMECPISQWRIYKHEVSDMTPQKLLNYHLQNLETSYNIHILWHVIKLLRNSNTKIVLYTYDSILLDVDKNEREVVKEIIEEFESYKLQVKMSYGRNYDFG